MDWGEGDIRNRRDNKRHCKKFSDGGVSESHTYHPFCWSSHGVGTKEYCKLDTRVLITAVLCHTEPALEFNTFMYSDQESKLILLD